MTAYVYEVYDAQGRLIYVGSTRDVFIRMQQHVTDSWWIDQVARVKASVYPTVSEARAEEVRRIRSLHPRWNVHRLPARHTWGQAQYHDYLIAKANRVSGNYYADRYANHYRRIAAEYRFRFGCDLMIPAVLAGRLAESSRAAS